MKSAYRQARYGGIQPHIDELIENNMGKKLGFTDPSSDKN